jgi:mannitol-specific phosphotransferase system IIBC component
VNVLKSLMGSLIGAAIATVIYYFLKPQNETSTLWFPILAGASTGLVAGIFGGRSRGSIARLISGVASAAVAIITMFGADVVFSRLETPKISQQLSAKIAEQGRSEKDDAPKAAGDTEATATDVQNKVEENADETIGEVSSGDKSEQAGADQKADDDAKAVEANRDASDSKQVEGGSTGIRGLSDKQPVPSAAEIELGAKMLAEMERKRKINYWLQLIMPGIGILLAYQFARGFRDQPAET